VAVAARCRYGLPVVVRTAPLLPDGTPFPTLYWLACPAARVAVGRLEAAGWNARLSERVATDPELAAAHAAAHAGYLAQRDAIAPLEGDPGVGGLPGRVKCLHALYAHHAATGADPVGRIVARWLTRSTARARAWSRRPRTARERAAGRLRRRDQLDPAAGGRRRRAAGSLPSTPGRW
jgi:hypothetical protein